MKQKTPIQPLEYIIILGEYPKELNTVVMGNKQHYTAMCIQTKKSIISTLDNYRETNEVNFVEERRGIRLEYIVYKKNEPSN